MSGAAIVSDTGPVASFDVPTRRIGSNATVSMGHTRPVDVPRTGAMGNSDTTSPWRVGRLSLGGHRKITSFGPRTMQDRSGCRAKTVSAAN